jgi:hypothetical protein
VGRGDLLEGEEGQPSGVRGHMLAQLHAFPSLEGGGEVQDQSPSSGGDVLAVLDGGLAAHGIWFVDCKSFPLVRSVN